MNHYKYLEKHLADFMRAVELEPCMGLIAAHGDKAYSFRHYWEEHGIPYHKGVAIYLLTYCRPFEREVRQTENGWVAPDSWVVNNKERFLHLLPD